MIGKLGGALIGAVVLVSPGAANATIIYEQATLHTDADLGAHEYFGQELADDFSLAAGAVVDTLSWKGGYWGADNLSGSESFTVHLYLDTFGLPALSDFYSFIGNASFTATGDSRSGQTIYDYFLDIPDVALLGGTGYWISIYTNDSPLNYAWSNSSDGGAIGAFRRSGGSWGGLAGVRSTHVFALNDGGMIVPEPASLAMFGVGLMGLAGASYRRRSRRRAGQAI